MQDWYDVGCASGFDGDELRAATTFTGAAAAVGLMVLGLWAWQHAAEVAVGAGSSRPYVAKWAVRSAAVAAASAAQAVLMIGVVGRVYERRGVLDAVVRLSVLLVFAVAVIGAVALGMAGR